MKLQLNYVTWQQAPMYNINIDISGYIGLHPNPRNIPIPLSLQLFLCYSNCNCRLKCFAATYRASVPVSETLNTY